MGKSFFVFHRRKRHTWHEENFHSWFNYPSKINPPSVTVVFLQEVRPCLHTLLNICLPSKHSTNTIPLNWCSAALCLPEYSLSSEIKAGWLHPHLHHKGKPHSPELLLPCTHTWRLLAFPPPHDVCQALTAYILSLRLEGWRLDLYHLFGDVTHGPVITQPDVIAFIPVNGKCSNGLGPLWRWLSLCSGLGHNMHSQPERSARVFVSHRMPFCCFIAFRLWILNTVTDALQSLSLSGLYLLRGEFLLFS